MRDRDREDTVAPLERLDLVDEARIGSRLVGKLAIMRQS
jgi:hypothetical protein